jgi:hypothetical protein
VLARIRFRDQTCPGGETEVTGRIIFPFSTRLGALTIFTLTPLMVPTRKWCNQRPASLLCVDGADLAYRSWQPDKRAFAGLERGETWQFNPLSLAASFFRR